MTPSRAPGTGAAALALLLGLYIFGLGRAALAPPFEGYDETGHYSYVAEMAALGTWPARGDPMSAETEAYARRAPGPPSAGGPWRYAAMPGASAADRAAAGAAVGAPTADPGWHGGAGANWEAQHPPLFYALLAPAFRLAGSWSLGARLFLLRSLSYTFAFGGLCCAAWAASAALRRPGPRDGAVPAEAALLAPVLWPVLLPEWFPEMARLGNDGLVALLAGVTALGLPRLLGRGRPAAGFGAYLGVGAAVGLGLLAKATFLPLAVAVGLLLALRAATAPDGRRARRLGVAGYAVAVLAVAGWWYLGQVLRTGDPIGANDSLNLARGEGFWGGLRHHLTPAGALRVLYDFDLSVVWGGTWSFVVPPLPFILPLMAAFPILVAAGLAARGRRLTPLDAVAPLTLGLFVLALLYYSLVLIAGGGLGQPAWYLHAFVPVLWPLLAWGFGAARRWGALRILLLLDLAYAPPFLLLATVCDAAFYAGCAGTRGGDRYVDVRAALSCLAEPARLWDGLALVSRPLPALWLLGSGFALLVAGVALGLRVLAARPGPAAASFPFRDPARSAPPAPR